MASCSNTNACKNKVFKAYAPKENFIGKKKNLVLLPRRDGRVVDCGGLENR
jgi:hypothetical protein